MSEVPVSKEALDHHFDTYLGPLDRQVPTVVQELLGLTCRSRYEVEWKRISCSLPCRNRSLESTGVVKRWGACQVVREYLGPDRSCITNFGVLS
jgi:hypothetical protein